MANVKADFDNLYQKDFHQWLDLNIQFLREGTFEALDIENLLAEIALMGRLERLKVKSILRLLLLQLLKWQHQPHNRSNDWVEIIGEYRCQLHDAFSESDHLKDFGGEVLQNCYEAVCVTMSTEDHLPVEHFPTEYFPDVIPFSFKQVLDIRYFHK
jgi:hypothetical protein